MSIRIVPCECGQIHYIEVVEHVSYDKALQIVANNREHTVMGIKDLRDTFHISLMSAKHLYEKLR